jgi:hypothetical protein
MVPILELSIKSIDSFVAALLAIPERISRGHIRLAHIILQSFADVPNGDKKTRP